MKLEIQTLQSSYAICQLSSASTPPKRPEGAEFWSLSVTAEEMSLVCETKYTPENSKADSGWRMFRVAGAMDLDEVGVLVRILEPLREAGISIFAISTFDTDYVLIREANFEQAIQLLREHL